MKSKIQSAKALGVLSLIGTALLLLGVFMFAYTFVDGTKASLLLAAIICLPIALGFLWLSFAQTQSSIILTDTELLFNVPVYGKRFAFSEIEVDQIQTANLSSDRGVRLFVRSNGVGVPGYQLGWFRLRDTRKALAAVTGDDVVIIPTRRGYSLVATVADPSKVANEIRQRAHATVAAQPT